MAPQSPRRAAHLTPQSVAQPCTITLRPGGGAHGGLVQARLLPSLRRRTGCASRVSYFAKCIIVLTPFKDGRSSCIFPSTALLCPSRATPPQYRGTALSPYGGAAALQERCLCSLVRRGAARAACVACCVRLCDFGVARRRRSATAAL